MIVVVVQLVDFGLWLTENRTGFLEVKQLAVWRSAHLDQLQIAVVVVAVLVVVVASHIDYIAEELLRILDQKQDLVNISFDFVIKQIH